MKESRLLAEEQLADCGLQRGINDALKAQRDLTAEIVRAETLKTVGEWLDGLSSLPGGVVVTDEEIEALKEGNFP